MVREGKCTSTECGMQSRFVYAKSAVMDEGNQTNSP